MPIPVVCPGCSAKLNAPDAAAGKKLKCPKCAGVIAVPSADADFEVVEDEPAPPPKKPAPAPAPAKPIAKPSVRAVVEEDDEDDEKPKKKPAKAVVEVDDDEEEEKPKKKAKAVVEDDEEDEKPKKKKPKAVVEADDDEDEKPRKKKRAAEDDEDEDDDRPKKKKKKRKDDEEEASSLVRNIIGGVVLIILLVVVFFVFKDRIFPPDDTKKTENKSNTDGGNPPGPNPPGPNPPGPGGNQVAKANPYTGDGVSGGTVTEEEGEIDDVWEKFKFDESGLWSLSLKKYNTTGKLALTGRVFLRPEQHAKIASLWPGQKIKIRGRKKSMGIIVGAEHSEFYAAEIVSTGPEPKFTEMTVDQLLKEFRDDPDAAEKKWRPPVGGDPPPWIKLTGVFDGPGPKEIQYSHVQLKGDAPDGAKPNRVVISIGGHEKNAIKIGERITVRVHRLQPLKESAGQVYFVGSVFPLPK